jgi:hypothetical protein
MISILLNVNLGGDIRFNVVTKVIKGCGRLPKSFYNQHDQCLIDRSKRLTKADKGQSKAA